MPWRGPSEPGEFPTLGYLLGDWIESTCVIPDGPRMGQPYLLTEEMWRHMLHAYRLRPDAIAADGTDAYVYSGSQLIRPQKWGKDPFAAVRCIAHGLGPVVFDGWDADGEPVGKPHPSAWIQCAATNEEQTDNTFRPIVSILREGPLSDTPGLQVHETRIKLPGIGWIEPVTASARGRLGARITFVTITESGLLVGTGPTGGRTLVRALKRNVAGMGGMWFEVTNAYDPSEESAAQATYEAQAKDVFTDYRPPRRRIPLDDEEAVMREVIYLYGDSAKVRGGWVSERRILSDIMNPATGESEARRFFLNEITAGAHDAVDAARWDALVRKDDPLTPGEPIAVGFDGSRTIDATAIRLCRLRDGRLFHGKVWVPAECPGGIIPRVEVHQYMQDVFSAYDVQAAFCDPYRWQDYLDTWSALWPKRVIEFPTNVETRMDREIERFLTAYRAGELTHDGHEVSTAHARNAAIAKGRKKAREDDKGTPSFFLKVVKKRDGVLIDDFVAGVLAYAARGHAIEQGALIPAPSLRRQLDGRVIF